MLVRFDVAELRRELGDEVDGFIMDVANEIVNEMKREAPVGATGDLRRSIQLFPSADQGVVYLGTRLSYARYVWKGTDPHTPPFEPIVTWSRRVLGDESAAGAVWQSIREEGTDPNPFVERAVDNATDRLA